MWHGEKGQALPLVLITIALGAMVIPAFLNNTGTSLIGARAYNEEIAAQYAADSGAEHAIWDLKYGDLSGQIPDIDDSVNYALGENVNGLSVNITVTKTGNPSAYLIVSSAGNCALDVSASVNSTETRVFSWQFE
jgi:hypothetical protein